MMNPLMSKANVVQRPTMDINLIREELKKRDPAFLNNIINIAKQRGISQEDIDAGLKLLKEIS